MADREKGPKPNIPKDLWEDYSTGLIPIIIGALTLVFGIWVGSWALSILGVLCAIAGGVWTAMICERADMAERYKNRNW